MLEADSLRHARDRLREKGWQVLAVQARRQPAFAGMFAGRWMSGVSSGDVALLTRQLATLLSAALPLEEALMAVARQTEKKGLQAALAQVRQRILEAFRWRRRWVSIRRFLTASIAPWWPPVRFPAIWRRCWNGWPTTSNSASK